MTLKSSNDPSSNQYNLNSNEEESSSINWALIIQILYNARLIILAVTLGSFLLAFFYASQLPDVYTATTKIRVEIPNDAQLVQEKAMVNKSSTEDRIVYYGTQIELLQSENVIQGVATDLDLPQRFSSSLSEVIPRIKDGIGISLVRGTEIIVISYTDSDSKLVADVANSLAKNYIKVAAQTRVKIPKEIADLLPNDGEFLKDKDSLDRFRLMTDEARIAVLPTITKDPLIIKLKQDLLDIQDQISTLSSRYTPEHPQIKELNQKIDFINTKILQQTKQLLTAIKSAMQGDFNVDNVSIVEKARQPSAPSGPDRRKKIIMITLFGLFSSIAVVVLVNYFYRRVHQADDLKEISDLAFLGYIPNSKPLEQKEKGGTINIIDQLRLDAQLSDAVHDTRNNIFFSMPKEHNKVMMCCSVLPNEGKSTVAAMLAVSMANLGDKTLIIDCDLRNPSVHKVFSKENGSGLSNCLIGEGFWKDFLLTVDKVPNLKLLCAGGTAPNSTALLSTPQISTMLKEMKEEFDHIILDVPPLLHIPDAYILGEQIDGMILIIKSGRIESSVLRQVKDKICSLKINLIGVIINRVDLKKLFKGYYHLYGSAAKPGPNGSKK